jgi:aryl-alcohol dehydrogenase-like predicted oxidoreductase
MGKMDRRSFLASSVGLFAIGERLQVLNPIPRRPYKKGIDLSIIGFGGIVLVGTEQDAANNLVAEVWDNGINYFDVAPSYWDGEAETKLGPALKPYRKHAFLACKTTRRDAAGAMEELDRSLERLQTDYFDLYQFHAVTSLSEVESIFAPGGAAESFLKAKKQGKIKHIGFSAHSEEAALALLDRFEFDSMLFPVNFVCYSQGNFGPEVVDKAREKGVARLALKAMAHSPWPEGTDPAGRPFPKCWYQPVSDPGLAAKALAFTLSQDITSVIPPGEAKLFRMAMNLASGFAPLSPEEQQSLLNETGGMIPLFKTVS